MLSHEACMALAIAQARLAEERGEIPVGAVVVKDGQVVGAGHNRTLTDCDPTGHAEVVALRAAAQALGNHRLSGCSLYVTLEPCAMCIGGIFHSRLEHVYFGAYDPKAGACGSVVNLPALAQINHHCSVHGGVAESACAEQLTAFFQKRRQEQRRDLLPLREDALRLPEGHLDPWMQGCTPLQWGHLRSAEGLRVWGWGNPKPASAQDHTLLLCLHGAASWGHLYRDLLLADLPARLAVWAIDLPGHGNSDKTKHGGELERTFQLAVLEEIISSSKFDAVHILAHDTGCALAIDLANRCNLAVRSLTLCNPIAGSAFIGVGGGMNATSPRSRKQLHAWIDTLSTGRSEFADAMCAPYPDAGHLRGLLGALQRPSGYHTDSSGLHLSCDIPVSLHLGAPYAAYITQHLLLMAPHCVKSVHQNSDYFLGLPHSVGRLIDLETLHG